MSFTIKKAVKNFLTLWGHFHWIILLIGIILCVYGYSGADFSILNMDFHKIAAKFGELIIIGCVFAFFSSYKYITKGYRDELMELLYGKDFLSTRNDIEVLWTRISKTILGDRFAPIQDKTLEIIKNTYLPTDYSCYYHNYKTTIILKWDTVNNDYIEIVEKIEFDVISNSTNKLKLNQQYNAKIKEDDQYCYAKMYIYVNGSSDPIIYDAERISNNMLSINQDIILEGCTKYHILKTTTRRLCITYDNYLCFKATYITNNMDLYIVHPTDMRITFVEKGTQNNFSSNIIHQECCIFKYNGVILPRQGYIIMLSKQN